MLISVLGAQPTFILYNNTYIIVQPTFKQSKKMVILKCSTANLQTF